MSRGLDELLLTKTKTGRPPVVPLTPATGGTIRDTPRHISAPWVFWHGDGERYRNLSSRLTALIGRSGQSFRVHDLRHRFAVDFLRRDATQIYRLSQILGHSSVKTTEIYLAYVGEARGQLDQDRIQSHSPK